MREVAEKQILIVTYNRNTDMTEIDSTGLSPLEVRGILKDALDSVCILEES